MVEEEVQRKCAGAREGRWERVEVPIASGETQRGAAPLQSRSTAACLGKHLKQPPARSAC